MTPLVVNIQKTGKDMILSRFLYLSRESNPNLIFRRDLFYPLNY